jgi:Family of unknown function (DUF6335)
MAKRRGGRATASTRSTKKTAKGRAATRPSARKTARQPAQKAAPKRKTTKSSSGKRPTGRKTASPARKTANRRARVPRLNRARRVLDGDTVLTTPPSSLNMDRRGSAARTGRAELDQTRRDHRSMTPEIAGGDVDVDVEDAYFTGEEAPGGDNPTPDQDIVDDIGKALGVEYADNEELKASDKVTERDKHRWELDPASSEDYKERD